jgi:hypothetical protein
MKLFISLLIASFCTGSATAAEQTPVGTVKKLYSAYGIGPNSGLTGLDDKLARALFDNDLQRLYKKAGATNVLDADFFVSGQDWSLVEPVQVIKETTKNAKSRVSVKVSLDDTMGPSPRVTRREIFSFLLAKRADGWRIIDAFNRGSSATSEWGRAIRDATRLNREPMVV